MNLEFAKPEKSVGAEILDERWYKRFRDVAAFEDYEYLSGERDYREDQKKKFFLGEIENPDLDYPELEKFPFTETEAALLELKKDILSKEPNEAVKQAYQWKINEKIAELRMLKAARESDDNKFFQYSKFIYGCPDQEVFSFNLFEIKNLVENSLASPYPNIATAAQKIYQELFSENPDQYKTTNIDQFPVSRVSSSSLFPKSERKYTAEEIKSAFQGALDIFQVKGFEVIVDKSGRVKKINVSQKNSAVNIPADRKFKESELKSLLVHEIGTHAQRRARGEISKLKLLGLGLDRYLKGEEGLAMYSEQRLRGMTSYAGLDGHLAVSLAVGLDGKKRNFREVFKILEDYFLIRSKEKGVAAMKNAREAAWDRCVRTFRGTSCKSRGVCFTRDIVYREGNIGIWKLLKNNPAEVRRFSIGKYDPSNPRHIWILDQLGITEDDLAVLDKES